MRMTLRPRSQKLAIDQSDTVFTRQPGRARRPISSAGSRASMAAIISG